MPPAARSSLWTPFFRHVRRRRVPWLAAWGLATLVLGMQAVGLERDNSLAAWVAPDEPDWIRFQSFCEAFGVSDPLMVYLPGTAGAEAEPLVRRLRRLESVGAAWILDFDAPPPGEDRACVVAVEPVRAATQAQLGRLTETVPATVPEELPGRSRHFGGVWWITGALNAWSDRATGTFFPVVFLLMTATVFLLLRDTRDAAVVLLCGVIPAVQLAGLMRIAGRSLNIVLVALPPLTLILGVTYAVHVLVQSRSGRGERLERMTRVVQPSLGAAGTTVIGFASLLLSGLEPVRVLGAWGAVGVVLSLAGVAVLVPALAGTEELPALGARWVPVWMRCHGRAGRWIVGASGVAVVLALLGAFGIRSESHVLSFFSRGADIRRDYRTIEGARIGLTPIEVHLEAPGKVFQRTRDWLSEWAEAHATVTHVLWPMDAGGRLRLTEATSHGAFLTVRPLPGDPNPLLSLAAVPPPTGRRVTLLIETLSTEGTLRFMDGLQADLRARLGAEGRATVTGSVPLLVRMQDRLLRTLLWSFGSAFVTIAAVMAFALRSVRLGLLALVPNILPVTWMLGVMGWCGIPLDVATVTVASITFSVIVDDTIHFLHAYREGRGEGLAVRPALERVLGQSGYAMAASTAATGISFLGFLASPFAPLRSFGLLTSLTLWLGLFCDTVFMPALLLLCRGDREDA